MGLIFTDIPELEGSKTDVVLSNLYELEQKFSALVERRLAHLSELSGAVIDDGEELDIIKSILLSIRSDGDADGDSVIAENKKDADIIYRKVSLSERLLLYRMISKKLFSHKKEELLHRGMSKLPQISKDAQDKIAYLKNPQNDGAYLALSSGLKRPKAAYFDSAEEVCHAVHSGKCEYCILPVETSDGRLSKFYELILKYKLSKCAEHEIKAQNGYTRYALLCRGGRIRTDEKQPRTSAVYVEFLFRPDEISSISDVLSVCEFCKMKLRRIDTVGSHICPSFKINGADISTFMIYLIIEEPSISCLGIYSQI